jgi:hypothetical protein
MMDKGVNKELARCLRALVVYAHAIHGDWVEQWVREKRLCPVIYGVDGAVDECFSPPFLQECRNAYFHMIGKSHRFLAEAERVTALLMANGIDSLAWRGAVYGQELYGDAGVRCYSDLDILVSPVHQRSALRVLCGAGYRLRNGKLPVWFLARHHLHWPMLSPDGQVPIDVHWAVDHPYTIGPRVPVDVFLADKHGLARILLAALHVEKEARLRTCESEEELCDRVFRVGPVWPWLDMALMISDASNAGRDDEMDQYAERQGAGILMGRVRYVLARWFDVSGDGRFIFRPTSKRTHRVGRPWVVTVAAGIGCRADVLLDWVDYAGETVSPVEKIKRLLKVFRLACDSAVVGVYGFGKGLFKRTARRGMALP